MRSRCSIVQPRAAPPEIHRPLAVIDFPPLVARGSNRNTSASPPQPPFLPGALALCPSCRRVDWGKGALKRVVCSEPVCMCSSAWMFVCSNASVSVYVSLCLYLSRTACSSACIAHCLKLSVHRWFRPRPKGDLRADPTNIYLWGLLLL